jgi:hypothetical protein
MVEEKKKSPQFITYPESRFADFRIISNNSRLLKHNFRKAYYKNRYIVFAMIIFYLYFNTTTT